MGGPEVLDGVLINKEMMTTAATTNADTSNQVALLMAAF